jgi:hypothetical protein
VPAFADVLDLLAHELSGLCARGLPLARGPAGPGDRLLLRHRVFDLRFAHYRRFWRGRNGAAGPPTGSV